MFEGSNLLKLVQEKLAEKEEIIHEQQLQIEELTASLRVARAAADGAGEKDEVIRAQMEQLAELNDQVEELQRQIVAGEKALEEKEEVIHEQMRQLVDYTERIEVFERKAAATEESLKEFESLQNQLKALLGES